MYAKLTIPERLKDLRVVDKHLTLEQLAEQTGLSKSALGKYETDDYKDISPFAIATLADFYGVSADYLMGLTETKNHPNTALYELHLSDSMIDLLKSGKMNNRLLCELVTHPDFLRLMADIEICVDRIADLHIKDMNYLLEETRRKAIEKYHPDDNDMVLRTLEVAQVSEDLFYAHILHDDLDRIVKDIRDAHKSDPTTADAEQSVQATMKNIAPMFFQALDYEGTMDEKRAFLVCRTLNIDYSKLSDDEKLYFARVCRKSPDLRNVFSQRGKAIPSQRRKKKK